MRLWLAWSKSVGIFLTDRTRALAPSTPSQMSWCQISWPRCLWKPSPGGLSMRDPTLPKRSPRAAPCLPPHSSRKRAPGNDRVRARTSGQGALLLEKDRCENASLSELVLWTAYKFCSTAGCYLRFNYRLRHEYYSNQHSTSRPNCNCNINCHAYPRYYSGTKADGRIRLQNWRQRRLLRGPVSCVRTLPGASLTISVSYCNGNMDQSNSLKGTVTADSMGSLELYWNEM